MTISARDYWSNTNTTNTARTNTAYNNTIVDNDTKIPNVSHPCYVDPNLKQKCNYIPLRHLEHYNYL